MLVFDRTGTDMRGYRPPDKADGTSLQKFCVLGLCSDLFLGCYLGIEGGRLLFHQNSCLE